MICPAGFAKKKPVRTDLIRWSLFSPKSPEPTNTEATLFDELRIQPKLNDLSLTPRFFTSRIEERDLLDQSLQKYQSQASMGFEISWNHHWSSHLSSEIFATSGWTHWGQSQEGRLENHSTVSFGLGTRTSLRPWRFTRISMILADQQEIMLRNQASGPSLSKSLIPSLGGSLEQMLFSSGTTEILTTIQGRTLFPAGSGIGAELGANFLEEQWAIVVGFFYERTNYETEDRKYIREDGGLKLSVVWNLESTGKP
jgi:hypothetical protein